ncbi:MAG: hypothetical protein Q9197_003830 [Variospora fuerteventurae]
MEPLAAAAVNGWNERKESEKVGLLAITFDQRNHGSREVDPVSNEAWRSGNKQHAQDMFSIYHGTASDTSLLMTYLSSYIFPSSDRVIATNVVLGVSLGGHAAWQCLAHDMRVSAAIIVIGCPDYFSLMSDRARLSKLESWVDSPTPGTHFLGSKDFPAGLVTAVELHDPAAMLLGKLDGPIRQIDEASPSPVERTRLLSLMKRLFQGKRILNLSGGTDKLVPYRCGEGFIKWLRAAAAPGGWFEGGIHVKDILFDNVGHQMSPEMVALARSHRDARKGRSDETACLSEIHVRISRAPDTSLTTSHYGNILNNIATFTQTMAPHNVRKVVKAKNAWTEEEFECACILDRMVSCSQQRIDFLNNRYGNGRSVPAVKSRISTAKEPQNKYHHLSKRYHGCSEDVDTTCKTLERLLRRRLLYEDQRLWYIEELVALAAISSGPSSLQAIRQRLQQGYQIQREDDEIKCQIARMQNPRRNASGALLYQSHAIWIHYHQVPYEQNSSICQAWARHSPLDYYIDDLNCGVATNDTIPKSKGSDSPGHIFDSLDDGQPLGFAESFASPTSDDSSDLTKMRERDQSLSCES